MSFTQSGPSFEKGGGPSVNAQISGSILNKSHGSVSHESVKSTKKRVNFHFKKTLQNISIHKLPHSSRSAPSACV